MSIRRALVSLSPLLLGILLISCHGDSSTPTQAAQNQSPAAPAVIQPSCANPAPLLGRYDSRSPGYIVVFKDGTDVATTVAQLQERYGFTATHVYTNLLPGFSAVLTPSLVASLRCEPVVSYVEYNSMANLF